MLLLSGGKYKMDGIAGAFSIDVYIFEINSVWCAVQNGRAHTNSSHEGERNKEIERRKGIEHIESV